MKKKPETYVIIFLDREFVIAKKFDNLVKISESKCFYIKFGNINLVH